MVVKRALDVLGTGRRKTAVARVRLRPGNGTVTVNGRTVENYFPSERHRAEALSALHATERRDAVDVEVTAHGGGVSGQAGAVLLGIARALKRFDVALEPALRASGLLTRDSREVERKKYGRKGARRSFQFSKR